MSVLLGCTGLEADSFIDPSTVGRWEHTPTVVPILERIDVIERDQGEFVETTPVTPEDLIPEITEYTMGPGDQIFVEIFDFLIADVAAPFERVIDGRGAIELPQIGPVVMQGLTVDQGQRRIAEALRQAGILEDALVSVQIFQRQAATFSLIGAIPRVGRYPISRPDLRLLEALADGGGVSQALQFVQVIRQVPLADELATQPDTSDVPLSQPIAPPTSAPGDDSGETPSLLDLIDDLTEPEAGPAEEPGNGEGENGDEGSPSVLGAPIRTGATAWAVLQDQPDLDPPIDIDSVAPEQDAGTQDAPTRDELEETGGWVYLNGRWVRVTGPIPGIEDSLPEGDDPLAAAGPTAEDLVTQRIIEIPVGPLLQGVAKYNIIIRPGDIIRIPGPEQGIVYLTGPGIARPGSFNLPPVGRLTLTKAVATAGGLSAIAIPRRVDLTRMVGRDRQATIRLDLGAIYSGTQPDIFLKPDDLVNFGTNFWAQPLAVVRNGFRASYGFGFLLDRNFGNDVFGAPPTNRDGI